ncbi:MAG TPA: thiaminase II [Solirubrobacteraceae bacterium]|nr:thiaminase II [Solirubrobacteraceae bacterium]
MSAVALSLQLRRAADPVWQAQLEHPFLRGIADGTLALERFTFYVRQDYLFLIEYARLLALGAARAPDLATMTRFAELTTEILATEMDLHRSFAASLGISPAELEAETPAPTTQGYTDFLVRTAAQGDFVELAAALLPCMWGYAEIGQALAALGRSPDDRYAQWVEMYASAEFGELAEWCRALVDGLADGLAEGGRARLERAFLTSSRYELAFWEMAWNGERWRV